MKAMTKNQLLSLKVGDIVLFGSRERPRIVRDIHRAKNRYSGEIRTSVTFVINRCSWTRRPCTVYCDWEVRRLCKVTGKRKNLKSKIDRQIAKDIQSRTPVLNCCAVEGIA